MLDRPLLQIRQSRLQFFGRIMEHAQGAIMLATKNGSPLTCQVTMIPDGIRCAATALRTKLMVPYWTPIPLGLNLEFELFFRQSSASTRRSGSGYCLDDFGMLRAIPLLLLSTSLVPYADPRMTTNSSP
jgi:hypothetical protein